MIKQKPNTISMTPAEKAQMQIEKLDVNKNGAQALNKIISYLNNFKERVLEQAVADSLGFKFEKISQYVSYEDELAYIEYLVTKFFITKMEHSEKKSKLFIDKNGKYVDEQFKTFEVLQEIFEALSVRNFKEYPELGNLYSKTNCTKEDICFQILRRENKKMEDVTNPQKPSLTFTSIPEFVVTFNQDKLTHYLSFTAHHSTKICTAQQFISAYLLQLEYLNNYLVKLLYVNKTNLFPIEPIASDIYHSITSCLKVLAVSIINCELNYQQRCEFFTNFPKQAKRTLAAISTISTTYTTDDSKFSKYGKSVNKLESSINISSLSLICNQSIQLIYAAFLPEPHSTLEPQQKVQQDQLLDLLDVKLGVYRATIDQQNDLLNLKSVTESYFNPIKQRKAHRDLSEAITNHNNNLNKFVQLTKFITALTENDSNFISFLQEKFLNKDIANPLDLIKILLKSLDSNSFSEVQGHSLATTISRELRICQGLFTLDYFKLVQKISQQIWDGELKFANSIDDITELYLTTMIHKSQLDKYLTTSSEMTLTRIATTLKYLHLNAELIELLHKSNAQPDYFYIHFELILKDLNSLASICLDKKFYAHLLSLETKSSPADQLKYFADGLAKFIEYAQRNFAQSPASFWHEFSYFIYRYGPVIELYGSTRGKIYENCMALIDRINKDELIKNIIHTKGQNGHLVTTKIAISKLYLTMGAHLTFDAQIEINHPAFVLSLLQTEVNILNDSSLPSEELNFIQDKIIECLFNFILTFPDLYILKNTEHRQFLRLLFENRLYDKVNLNQYKKIYKFYTLIQDIILPTTIAIINSQNNKNSQKQVPHLVLELDIEDCYNFKGDFKAKLATLKELCQAATDTIHKDFISTSSEYCISLRSAFMMHFSAASLEETYIGLLKDQMDKPTKFFIDNFYTYLFINHYASLPSNHLVKQHAESYLIEFVNLIKQYDKFKNDSHRYLHFIETDLHNLFFMQAIPRHAARLIFTSCRDHILVDNPTATTLMNLYIFMNEVNFMIEERSFDHSKLKSLLQTTQKDSIDLDSAATTCGWRRKEIISNFYKATFRVIEKLYLEENKSSKDYRLLLEILDLTASIMEKLDSAQTQKLLANKYMTKHDEYNNDYEKNESTIHSLIKAFCRPFLSIDDADDVSKQLVDMISLVKLVAQYHLGLLPNQTQTPVTISESKQAEAKPHEHAEKKEKPLTRKQIQKQLEQQSKELRKKEFAEENKKAKEEAAKKEQERITKEEPQKKIAEEQRKIQEQKDAEREVQRVARLKKLEEVKPHEHAEKKEKPLTRKQIQKRLEQQSKELRKKVLAEENKARAEENKKTKEEAAKKEQERIAQELVQKELAEKQRETQEQKDAELVVQRVARLKKLEEKKTLKAKLTEKRKLQEEAERKLAEERKIQEETERKQQSEKKTYEEEEPRGRDQTPVSHKPIDSKKSLNLASIDPAILTMSPMNQATAFPGQKIATYIIPEAKFVELNEELSKYRLISASKANVPPIEAEYHLMLKRSELFNKAIGQLQKKEIKLSNDHDYRRHELLLHLRLLNDRLVFLKTFIFSSKSNSFIPFAFKIDADEMFFESVNELFSIFENKELIQFLAQHEIATYFTNPAFFLSFTFELIDKLQNPIFPNQLKNRPFYKQKPEVGDNILAIAKFNLAKLQLLTMLDSSKDLEDRNLANQSTYMGLVYEYTSYYEGHIKEHANPQTYERLHIEVRKIRLQALSIFNFNHNPVQSNFLAMLHKLTDHRYYVSQQQNALATENLIMTSSDKEIYHKLLSDHDRIANYRIYDALTNLRIAINTERTSNSSLSPHADFKNAKTIQDNLARLISYATHTNKQFCLNLIVLASEKLFVRLEFFRVNNLATSAHAKELADIIVNLRELFHVAFYDQWQESIKETKRLLTHPMFNASIQSALIEPIANLRSIIDDNIKQFQQESRELEEQISSLKKELAKTPSNALDKRLEISSKCHQIQLVINRAKKELQDVNEGFEYNIKIAKSELDAQNKLPRKDFAYLIKLTDLQLKNIYFSILDKKLRLGLGVTQQYQGQEGELFTDIFQIVSNCEELLGFIYKNLQNMTVTEHERDIIAAKTAEISKYLEEHYLLLDESLKREQVIHYAITYIAPVEIKKEPSRALKIEEDPAEKTKGKVLTPPKLENNTKNSISKKTSSKLCDDSKASNRAIEETHKEFSINGGLAVGLTPAVKQPKANGSQCKNGKNHTSYKPSNGIKYPNSNGVQKLVVAEKK